MELRNLSWFFVVGILWVSCAQKTVVNEDCNDFRVVAYVAGWNDVQKIASQLPYCQLTHINYAFTHVADTLGSLVEIGADLDTLVKYAHAAGVEVFISLGGGSLRSENALNYAYSISDSARRVRLVTNIARYLDAYRLDGFDVDIEGPAIDENYGPFVALLADTLHARNKKITAALGFWGGDRVPDSILSRFDWINVMAYDATGNWPGSEVGPHSSFDFAQECIEHWVQRGARRDNLVLGVPFYGYAFYHPVIIKSLKYSEIQALYPGSSNSDSIYGTIFFNGVETIREKTRYAMANAGGIMIWEITGDTLGDISLMKAIYNELKSVSVIQPAQ
jgi:GH18 family chitinase